MTINMPHKAHCDGFTQETLPAATVGNRAVSVFIKINPPILTSESNQDRYLSFRWFDANTNQTIQHATFMILVTKHDQALVHSIFHTHTGLLTLKIAPSNIQSEWKIIGDIEPFLDGYVYLPKANETISLVAPMLGEGGLYHIYMLLLTIDNDQNLFMPEDAPRFDSYLSVGDVSNHSVTYHNNFYNTTLVSYYDKVTNYIFDPSKMQISWIMPFDWNTTRFQDMPVFVHEELRIPKSFKEFTTQTFTASVNGNPIASRKIVSDPYSINDTEIVHILINKNDIENLSRTTPLQASTMNFTVTPMATDIITSSSLLTDFGGWEIKLQWNPSNISANSKNDLQMTFSDAFTEQKIMGDVNYDLKIMDKDNNTEFSRAGITAKNGTDTQPIDLPNNGIYDISVKINSIVNNGLPDTSRTGLARGNVVVPSITNGEAKVPEFGNLAGMVVIICLIGVVVICRKLSNKQYLRLR